jgi:hypothetical protein
MLTRKSSRPVETGFEVLVGATFTIVGANVAVACIVGVAVGRWRVGMTVAGDSGGSVDSVVGALCGTAGVVPLGAGAGALDPASEQAMTLSDNNMQMKIIRVFMRSSFP